MLENRAYSDGVTKDVHYEKRMKQWAPDRWKIFQKTVDKVLKFSTPLSVCLDLGAGEGFFTKCCKEAGLKCIAFEGSQAAVNWGKSNLGIDSRMHNLKNSLPLEHNSVDFIMYHNVYEHVPQHINKNVFKESFRVLKPEGILWVTTICKYNLVESAKLEHINNTTPSQLYRFGKSFGFKASIVMPTFNFSLFTPNLYDKDLNVCSRKKKIRDWAKRNNRKISFALAPLWFPIWFLNSRVLHVDALDFLNSNASIIFKKNKYIK